MIPFPYRSMALSPYRPYVGDSDHGDGSDNSTYVGLAMCQAWLSSEHLTRVLTHTTLPVTLAGAATDSRFIKVGPREGR